MKRFPHNAQVFFLTDLEGVIHYHNHSFLFYHAGMVIYVYRTPKNNYYEVPNPRPIQRKKIHFVSPNSPKQYINAIFIRINSIYVRQLKTEDCSRTEHNQHTHSTAEI